MTRTYNRLIQSQVAYQLADSSPIANGLNLPTAGVKSTPIHGPAQLQQRNPTAVLGLHTEAHATGDLSVCTPVAPRGGVDRGGDHHFGRQGLCERGDEALRAGLNDARYRAGAALRRADRKHHPPAAGAREAQAGMLGEKERRAEAPRHAVAPVREV